MAALRFVAGWGLLRLRPWGRTFSFAMGFFCLIQPPFDTAPCVYALFVLLPDAACDEYRQMSQASMASVRSKHVSPAFTSRRGPGAAEHRALA